MRFGGEVDDDVKAFAESGADSPAVGNVAMYEAVIRFIQSFEIVEVSGVGERVEIENLAAG